MELTWMTVVKFVGTVWLGLMVYWFLLRPLVRRQLRRLANKGRPPKGTRPRVWLHHDEMIYDLTDDLLRVDDAADGDAVWVVWGPAHLRFTPKDSTSLKVSVGNPVPWDTELRFEVISPPGETDARFMTGDELIKKYPELAGQLH